MGENAPVSSGSSSSVRVVGVAGKSCAGKDLVTRWFRDRNWREINVDHLGHRALEQCREQIIRVFGPSILNDDRSAIDRGRLGKIVFSNTRRREELEAIVHPWMRAEVRRETTAFRSGDPAFEPRYAADAPRGLVINAALLFYMELDQHCDVVIFVRAPLLLRLIRAIRRDGLSWRRVVLRLWSQRAVKTQAERSPADIITVDNRGTPEALRRRLAAVKQLL